MPRRERPRETRRSERCLRVVVNDRQELLNARVANALGWSKTESITWLSPVRDDNYAEYYDQEFLNRLGLPLLPAPLTSFWPASGPRWDALARTDSGRVLLVEAKAYIEESVDFVSRASDPKSLSLIKESLEKAKLGFGARPEAPWGSPFYQTANRLAHLHFLWRENGLDAWLLFVYFANAPDVPEPCTVEQWEGAIRLTKKCLGLRAHLADQHVGDLIWDCALSEL
jgi:hypothetical protein